MISLKKFSTKHVPHLNKGLTNLICCRCAIIQACIRRVSRAICCSLYNLATVLPLVFDRVELICTVRCVNSEEEQLELNPSSNRVRKHQVPTEVSWCDSSIVNMVMNTGSSDGTTMNRMVHSKTKSGFCLHLAMQCQHAGCG